MPYIWAILSNDEVLEAAQAVFNGSAGQQRVSESFLKKFPLPLPPFDLQVKLANKLFQKRNQLLEAKKKAADEWQAAKYQFEKDLLGE